MCLEYYSRDDGILKYDNDWNQLLQKFFSNCRSEQFYVKLTAKMENEILNLDKLYSYIEENISQKLDSFLLVDMKEFSASDLDLEKFPSTCF